MITMILLAGSAGESGGYSRDEVQNYSNDPGPGQASAFTEPPYTKYIKPEWRGKHLSSNPDAVTSVLIFVFMVDSSSSLLPSLRSTTSLFQAVAGVGTGSTSSTCTL